MSKWIGHVWWIEGLGKKEREELMAYDRGRAGQEKKVDCALGQTRRGELGIDQKQEGQIKGVE